MATSIVLTKRQRAMGSFHKLVHYLKGKPRLADLVWSGILVVLAFPDVLIRRASLLNTDQLVASELYIKTRPMFSVMPKRHWWESYNDNGGAIWQSEPMMEFMRFCLRTLNSPYWNPYSAAGSMGPETLVDLKFSAVTVLYTLLGGGSYLYTALMLLLYTAAGYCVMRFVRVRLGLSTVAAVAATGFYILNGYAAANIGSNVFLSYLFLPLCLLTSAHYIDGRTSATFARMALSYAILLSFSFLPTTMLHTLALLICTTGYLLSSRHQRTMRQTFFILLGQAGAMVVAVAILAVFFLPFVESVTQTNILDQYQHRVFYESFFSGILSLFTPSHFYESYNAMETAATVFFKTSKGQFTANGNTVYHFGIVGMLMAAAGLRNLRWRWLIYACLFSIGLGLGRIFAVPGIYQIVDHLPILRNVGCQYWWALVSPPLTLLVALGVHQLDMGQPSRRAIAIVLAIGLGSAIYIGSLYGLHGPRLLFKCLILCFAAVLTGTVAWVIFKKKERIERLGISAAVLMACLLIVELNVDAKPIRMPNINYFDKNTPTWVNFLRANIGPYRTLTLARMGLMGERGSAFQIPEVTSMNEGTLGSYTKYFATAITLDPLQGNPSFVTLAQMEDTPEKNTIHWDRMNLLGVKYVLIPMYYPHYREALVKSGLRLVLDDPQVTILENPNYLPRAFTVDMKTSALSADVTLPPLLRKRITPVEIATYRNAEVVLKGVAPAPRLLVLSDNWHPNWQARVNGQLTPILKVDGTFRGVIVPAGAFEVSMTYRPKTLTAALVISAFATLLTGILASGILSTRVKPTRPEPSPNVP